MPSSTPSASSCCTTRSRLAPSAPRSAISLARPCVRTSIRLARLAQAMSSTSATAPSRTSSDEPRVADQVLLQRHDQRAPVLVLGGILLLEPGRDRVEVGLRAWRRGTPGFSLATPR